MSVQKTTGCDKCNKSGLSLLLLRRSPIAKSGALLPPGSQSVQTDASGLAADPAPKESRYVLRLLRQGYVHVYIPKPPEGVKNWLIYRVTDNADLIEESNPTFSQMPPPKSCANSSHNAAGMRLLHIPQAHKIPKIWIAFSGNLWNDKLKKQNKANPEVMQEIDLVGGSTLETFKPTADNLRSKVLECALLRLRINKVEEHDFRFNSLASIVDSVAENLTKAAACHGATKGKELAVVLRDPVAEVVELNALRLWQHEIATVGIKTDSEKPENQYALKSSDVILGLKELLARVEYAKALDEHAPIVPFSEFSKPKPTNPFFGATVAPSRYKEKEWEELEEFRLPGDPLGRAWPKGGSSAVPRQKADKAFAKTWSDIDRYYKEDERAQWVKSFHERMKKQYLDLVVKFEDDWWAACKSNAFKRYFELHFDENDPNVVLHKHSCGLVYAHEVSIATTPAPFTTGQVLSDYAEQLNADPNQPSSVMLRALVANQKEIIDKLQPVWAIVEAGIHAHEKRNDKLYDLGVALIHKIQSSSATAKPRYRWLAPTLGNLFGAYALTIAQGLIGAVSALSAKMGAAFLSSQRGRELLVRAQGLAMVQRTTDAVLEAVIRRTKVRIPLQITKEYPSGRGIWLLATIRGSHTRSEASGLIREGKIQITLLTDTVEMAKYGGKVESAMMSEESRIKTSKQVPVLLWGTTEWRGLKLSDADFEKMWLNGQVSVDNAKKAVQEIFKGKQKVLSSLDGRLALGAVLLNGLGLISSLGKIDNQREEVRRTAWFMLIDASTGVLGGVASLWELVLKQRLILEVGERAVEGSVTIHELRFAGHILGAVAGVVNGTLNWLRGTEAIEAEEILVGKLYRYSAVGFLGTAGTFTILAVGAMADRMVAKGVQRAVVMRVAARFGARGTLAASVNQLGWILLGLAVLFEVGAVLMTPSEMQKWAGRTRFGNRSSGKFVNWEAEEAELKRLLAPAA